MRQYRRVSDVNLCTAGIVSMDTRIPGCGRVIMYDFAGQAEYYSSHAALCENLRDVLLLSSLILAKPSMNAYKNFSFGNYS